MKRVFLSRLLIVFSAAALFISGAIYACWDYDELEFTYDSNFTPETFADASYTPLFLSPDVFYNKQYGFVQNPGFNTQIVNEWSAYMDKKINLKTIQFLFVDSLSNVVVEDLYDCILGKKKTISNRLAKKLNLKDEKTRNLIEFLHYSKAIETVSADVDYWSYENHQEKNFKDEDWIKSIENKYSTTDDNFLKNRYWFQTIKAWFYSDTKQNAIDFFLRTESEVPKNTLYYRAVAYIAGVEYHRQNYARSNYLYSQVFDKCPEMRTVAAYCFHPQEETDWIQSLSMAKNTDEKAALWAIQGYYGDEEKAIKMIYGLDAKNKHLNFLLTRLVNKQEKKINQSFTTSVSINKKQIKDSLDISAISLVNMIAKSNTTEQPFIWNMAAGYLSTLEGNFAVADNYFDTAEKKTPKTKLALVQLRLLRFVNNLSKIDVIDPNNEKTIVSDLDWLYNQLPNQQITDFRYQNATQWSKAYLSALYKSQSNNVLSELFVRNPNFYNNESDLQAMLTFLLKKNKTALEKVALGVYDVSIDDIYEYQAVKATFRNDIRQAILFMKKTETVRNELFLTNPFNGFIKDCHDCEISAGLKGKKYSKLEFLLQIENIQKQLSKNENVYNNSLLLGNAFYNISHFGNGRIFYECNIIGAPYTPMEIENPTRKMITDCTIASMYYKNALAAALNSEAKAKCHYMLAKCERNQYYNATYYSGNENWDLWSNDIKFFGWDNFAILKKQYSNTAYYQEIINECDYFNSYVKKAP